MPVVPILITHDISRVRSLKFGILVPVQEDHPQQRPVRSGRGRRTASRPASHLGATRTLHRRIRSSGRREEVNGVQLGIDVIYSSASEVDRLTVRS
jgi:hypothetical protein